MYISIHYNPSAPKKVPSEVIDHLLVMDLDIIDLERRSKALYTKIK